MKKLLFTVLLGAMAAFAGDVTIWVPPYYITECKNTVDMDFGGIKMKDAITNLALQFWTPNPDNPGQVVFQPKYAGSSSSKVNDDNVKWFVNWGKTNKVPVILCIYNSMKQSSGSEMWDWDLVHKSISSTYRTSFVNSILAQVDKFGLDGVDIDFEGNDSKYDVDWLRADSTNFYAFSQQLADSLHKRGKIVNVAVFNDKWNVPGILWWQKLLKIYDGVETMGYTSATAPISGSEAQHKYQYDTLMTVARQGGADRGRKLMIGLPSDATSWKGTTLDANLDWLLKNGKMSDTSTVGLCIWDAALKSSAWKTKAVWEKVAKMSADVRAKRNAQGLSSSSKKASSSSSAKVSSSSQKVSSSSSKKTSSSSSAKVSSSSQKASSSSASNGTIACKAWSASLFLVNGNWSDGPVIGSSGTSGTAYRCKAGQGSYCYYYEPDNAVYGAKGSWPVYETVGTCGGQAVSSSSQKASSSSQKASSSSVKASSSSQKVSSSSQKASSSSASNGGSCGGVPAFATGTDFSSKGYKAVWNNALYSCENVPYFCNVGAGHTPVSYGWTKLGDCSSVAPAVAQDYDDGTTALTEKAFALPESGVKATVYGVTGRAILALPAQAWSSQDQLRDAVRGQLPAGVYLVKFEGAAQAIRISVDK
ncbi:MAG: hypothetical protein J6Z50_04585 [Fibrobacterales bacterium]|nr:hypothetical protein [Fibrobacterales bacterium]